MIRRVSLKKMMILLSLLLNSLHASTPHADVTAVSTKGADNYYHFSVTIKSEETGCDQYANWWEVLSEQGDLLYRRILIHSHPDMQPFTRSGGYVKIKKEDIVYVRAHMNTLGYGGTVLKGSVKDGFEKVKKVPSFDERIEKLSPLPSGCLY